MKRSYRKITFILMIVSIIGILSWSGYAQTPTPTAAPSPTATAAPSPTPTVDAPSLDPNTIPKFVNQISKPGVYVPTEFRDNTGRVVSREYTVSWAVTFQQVLPPGFPPTKVVAYGGLQVPADDPTATPVFRRSVPGATFELIRFLPTITHWRNEFDVPQFLPVDPTLDWANPNNFPPPCPPFIPFPPGYPQAQFPVANVTHTHGIEVRAKMDGTPDEWFTFNGIVGPNFLTRDYEWPVSNESSAFWYHDHAFGVTRLNVYPGLSGFHIIRDPNNPLDQPGSPLPQGKYEMQLLVKDVSFNKDGSLWYPRVGDVPNLHPYWRLMFDGQVNTVNGKVWPNMNVERHQYRFRILNAADQRFYRWQMSNGMPITVIGTDGGYRETPAVVTSLLQGVTERFDILLDFSPFPAGTKIIMQNTEQLQPPIGPPPDPNLDGTVMQFTVIDSPVVPPAPLPARLNTIANLTPNAPPRILVQNVQLNAAGQIITAMLDGRLFHNPVQEFPQIGSTDVWQFTNITPLDHVKHVHLIQFQVQDRQPFDSARYSADWFALNGPPPFDHPTIRLPVEPYLTGPAVPPRAEEVHAWKDSMIVLAGFVNRMIVRWAPQALPTGAGIPGVNEFPFTPFETGYVWHCHLLEHEDNEMIQQLVTVPFPNFPDWFIGTTYNVGDRVRFGDKEYEAIQPNVASQANRPDIAPTVWRVIAQAPSINATPLQLCTPSVTPSPTITPTITPSPTPTPTPTPTTAPAIGLQFYNGNRAASINTIFPWFKLTNTGSSPLALSNVKMRYYYTIDGVRPMNFFCDFSQVGTANVTGSFVQMATQKTGADSYVEVGFTSAAGNLAPGASVEAQCRIAKDNWTNFTQTNDYSFNATATNYVNWNTVTGWVSGVLKSGTEP